MGSGKFIHHTVQEGETLFAISRHYHITVDNLRSYNALAQGEILRVGRTLKIPTTYHTTTKPKPTSTRGNIRYHRVMQGDTLYSLAKRYNISLTTLLVANNIDLNKPLLKLGQLLRIPQTLQQSSHNTPKYASLGKTSQKRAHQIIVAAKAHLGNRYVWGATGDHTFDCSGLTNYVYRKNGIVLPRRAIDQSRVGLRVKKSQLQPGDLVFFDTSKEHRGYVNHVGIYIGQGKFIHASSAKKRVVITSLNKPFYARHFMLARRYTIATSHYASAR